MKRLIAIGDHWTSGKGIEQDKRYKYEEPDQFIKNERLMNSWPRWLADKFEIPFINIGNEIFDANKIRVATKRALADASTEDLIVIMWGHPYKHLNRPVAAGITIDIIIKDMLECLEGYNYFLCNAYYPFFREEPVLKEALRLHRFLDIDRSAADVLLDYALINDRDVWNYNQKDINKDRFGLLHGHHCPNLFGHKLIAEWLYEKIVNR
ncbi:MAG: SGNH/GDSL hydrolase family protein [Synechococcaceae bacterium WB8_1B_057]|nr:SGNH/GDSL hydrolase family protein [Synechococcaceae bacterium WB6_1A_059]NDG79939.1 SGNH/GDSL hydrolase family protein [Synechococcaceae bacterium WB8_1B_057]